MNIRLLTRALGGFSSEALIVRRNLLLTSSMALIFKLLEGKIESLNFLGVHLIYDVTSRKIIDAILFACVTYHMVHFLLQTTGEFYYWRIRLTGLRNRELIVGGDDEYLDRDGNPLTPSLMSWWLIQKGHADQYIHNLTNNENLNNDQAELLKNLTNRVKNVEIFINEKRILKSLENFENWFRMFHTLESIRFFIFEWSIPVILGGFTLYEILCYENQKNIFLVNLL